MKALLKKIIEKIKKGILWLVLGGVAFAAGTQVGGNPQGGGEVPSPCNARQGQVVDAVTGKYELLCTNGRISIIDPEDQKLMTPEQRVADSISKINAAIPDVDKDISFDETGKFLNVRILNNEVN